MSSIGKNPSVKWITYEPQATIPTSPNEGDFYYNDGSTATEGLYVYINAAWAQVSTSVASSVFSSITLTPSNSDPGSPATGMIFYASSSHATRNEGIYVYTNSGWNQITGKRYQEFIPKALLRVRAATTSNKILASDFENGDTIDGVVLKTGNLILVKDQSPDTTQNGVYVVAASGAPTRDTSADTFSELNRFAVAVSEGTTNKNTRYYQTATLTSLSDPQTWSTTPATYTFTVPTAVYELDVVAIIGGSGGGSGQSYYGSGNGTQGGAGGNGGGEVRFKLNVTPGDVFTLVPSVPGAGGYDHFTGGYVNGSGRGSSSGNTSIVGASYNILFPGIIGGANGIAGATNSAAIGATGYDTNTINTGLVAIGGTAGGNSGGPGAHVAGVAAATNIFARTGAAGGAAAPSSNRGVAGGGGGTGAFGIGGVGGAGTSAIANPGVDASATNYGAGGGGGSGTLTTAAGTSGDDADGGHGGNGAPGLIRIYY